MFTFDILEWKETSRNLTSCPKSYVGTIKSLFYYFMAEDTHRHKKGICKRDINLLPEKDIICVSREKSKRPIISRENDWKFHLRITVCGDIG